MMKKKITAAFLAAAMMISAFPAMAADGMESALVTVKSRIDVPQELTEFRSQTSSDDRGTQYMFIWRDKESKDDLTVSADDAGHISSYRYYAESEAEKEVFRPRSEYYAAAESFLKKAAPELFSNDDDRIVNKENNSVIRDNTATLSFERQIGGIPVVGNDASVTVKYRDGSYTVISCNINWDYKTQTESADHAGAVEAKKYYEVFPLEMVYRKPVRLYFRAGGADGEKVELIYRFKYNQAGYVDIYSGEAVKPDNDEIYGRFNAAAKGGGIASAENAAADLTPQEIEELNNVADLKPAESIIAGINAMNAFGALPAADKYSKRIYKQGEKYFVSMDYSSFNDAKDEIPVGVHITVDGQTGELISLSSYRYYEDDISTDDKEDQEARKKIADFLTANFSDKMSVCDGPEANIYSNLFGKYPRYVGGIKYVDNYMQATYDTKRGIISNFNQVWDDDVSSFTDPAKAIDTAAAEARMEEYAPVHKVYVKSGDVFRLCYASDGADAEIDAVSGEKIKSEYSYDDPEVYSYTDISGHWAESVINSISQYGVGLPGEEFLPDKEITQSELLGMLSMAMGYGLADEESLYQMHKDIIRDGEKAPDSAVLREDAFVLMIRSMGYEKIAGMDIFQPGFNDGTDVSPEKSGALAILRGYGIVEGDAGSVRPKAKLTRAEAAALIYNYLTKA